jgi:serine/threonine protein kinase
VGSSTAATDFFSLGCILYEVLVGKRAFQRESVADTLSAILNDQLDFGDISRHWPDELVGLSSVVWPSRPHSAFNRVAIWRSPYAAR